MDTAAPITNADGTLSPHGASNQPLPVRRPLAKNPLKAALSLLAAFVLGVCLGLWIMWLNTSHRVVASVNGTPIYASDFYHRLQIAAGTPTLKQMMEEELQIQYAQSIGASPTDAQIQAKLAKAQAQPNFAATLTANHESLADLRYSLMATLSESNAVTQAINVSPADVQQFYQENINPNNPQALYFHPAESQVAIILTPSHAQAQAALQALASGQSFASVAQTYSKDKSATNGGVLAPIAYGHIDSAKYPGFQSAIFALSVGQQTGPIQIAGNWWIIRCIGKAPQSTVPFSQVADDYKEGALLQKGLIANGANVQSKMAAFQQKAALKINLPGYASLLPPK